MTLYEFNDLDELEQSQAVWTYGIELGRRTDETYLYILYSLDRFYVETKRHIEYDVPHGLRSFSSSTPLEPYLGNIDISSIIPSS